MTNEDIPAEAGLPNFSRMSHLMQQALEELGRTDIDAAELADRVRRLEYGLPAEDHFIALALDIESSHATTTKFA